MLVPESQFVSMRNVVLSLFVLYLLGPLNVKSADKENNILDWDPPKELKKQYPYFMSGLDKTGHPILVLEYGRWDVRATAEKGGQAVEEFNKYTEQMWARWFSMAKVLSTPEKPVDSIFCLAELEGFDLRQFSHTGSIQLLLNMMKQFAEAWSKGGRFNKAFVVNTNYLFQTAYNLGKPLLGELAEHIVLYGTNKEKWVPVLLQYIDKDQLPDWLGGVENHKPVKVFG